MRAVVEMGRMGCGIADKKYVLLLLLSPRLYSIAFYFCCMVGYISLHKSSFARALPPQSP